jgi:hypothetical protein
MHVYEAIVERIAFLGSQTEIELLGSDKIRRLGTHWWHGGESGAPLLGQDLLAAISELCRELEADGYIAKGAPGRYRLTATGKAASKDRFFAALSRFRVVEQHKCEPSLPV